MASRASRAGAPSLAKPWTIGDLLRKVREVLDGPRVELEAPAAAAPPPS